MSTRILFADDSVTAQNMGKRILTEAGYDVVAVSNGAAAVKKIAEQKPDIIILDLYMPGYSGLEVCEKVRGSMATLKTPVLLTVGKMEPPPRPEDANRVRADGVIVKPFEASDLLAIIKKFEERITPSPPPLAQQAMAAEPDYATEPVVDLSPPHAVRTSPPQPMVDVPDHMASSSAFSDLLGIESAGSSPEHSQASVAYRTGGGLPEPGTGISEHEIPAAWKREEEAARAEVELPVPGALSIEPPQHDLQAFESAITKHEVLSPESTGVAPPPVPSRPLQIPVYQESAETAEDSPELMPTAAPRIGEIEIPRDPYLEPTAAETTRNTIAKSTEPGLMSGLQPEQYDAAVVQQQSAPLDSDFSITHSREISVDVPVDAPLEVPQAAPESPAANYVDTDFETRVAAALASYNRSEGAASADSSSSVAGAPDPASETTRSDISFDSKPGLGTPRAGTTQNFPENARVSQEMQPAVSDHMDNAVSAFEYHPPVGGSFPNQKPAEEPFSAPMPPAVAIKPDSEPASVADFAAFEPAISTTVHREAVTNQQSASDRLRSAAETQARDSITHAVSRVIERLKPELVDEILRELNSKE